MICKKATLLNKACTDGFSRAIVCADSISNCIRTCNRTCKGWTPVEIKNTVWASDFNQPCCNQGQPNYLESGNTEQNNLFQSGTDYQL
jgi:hypothetical protein